MQISPQGDYYQSPEALRFYQKLVLAGLYPFEEEMLKEVTERGHCLVIGCGAGREAFALEKMGWSITAIDTCAAQIEAAKALKIQWQTSHGPSKVHFLHSDVFGLTTQIRHDFDLLWLTVGLTGHIQGHRQRERFFTHLKSLGTQSLYFPDVHPNELLQPWSPEEEIRSQQLRAWLPNWEPGDTLRSDFGAPEQVPKNYFYHFYLSQSEAESECLSAGWKIQAKSESGFLLRR